MLMLDNCNAWAYARAMKRFIIPSLIAAGILAFSGFALADKANHKNNPQPQKQEQHQQEQKETAQEQPKVEVPESKQVVDHPRTTTTTIEAQSDPVSEPTVNPEVPVIVPTTEPTPEPAPESCKSYPKPPAPEMVPTLSISC